MITSATVLHHENNWRYKQMVSLVGSVVTGVVFLILVATKFVEGAWVVALIIPILVVIFHQIDKHYERVADSLSTRQLAEQDLGTVADVALVPIADVHRGTLQALQYARRLSNDVRAVCIATSPEVRERVERRWARFPKLTEGVELVIIEYDFRDVLEPLIEYIEKVNSEEFPGEMITIVIPEFIAESTAARLLHNQTANILRGRLRHLLDVIVIDVPYHIPARKDEDGNDQVAGTADSQ